MGLSRKVCLGIRAGFVLVITILVIVAFVLKAGICSFELSYTIWADVGMFETEEMRMADFYEEIGIGRTKATYPQGAGIAGLCLMWVCFCICAVGHLVVRSPGLLKVVVAILDVICAVLYFTAGIVIVAGYYADPPGLGNWSLSESDTIGAAAPLFFLSFVLMVFVSVVGCITPQINQKDADSPA
ncbi:hypothetical protein DIPPA_29220 [Diplonema papillatum]|nr:hypothetical protein DIPPA_29220 [Diplonema papillatum]